MFRGVGLRIWFVFVLCVLGSLALVVWTDTYGDEGGEQAPAIEEKGDPEYSNLDSQLRALLEAFESGADSGDDAGRSVPGGLPPVGPVDPMDGLPYWDPVVPLPQLGAESPKVGLPPVDVTIYVTRNIDAVARFLTSNGVSIRNMGSTYLEASVPVVLLGEVSERPGVIRVERIVGPHMGNVPGPNLPTVDKGIRGDVPPVDMGIEGAASWTTTEDWSVAASGLGWDEAPQIPEKSPQRFANLTSDLDAIAKDVDAGVFSVDSVTSRSLMYERSAGGDAQSPDDGVSVGVTIYALEDIGSVASFLKRNGVAIRHQGETYLEAYVPVGLLGQASLQPDVIRIEPIVGPWMNQMMTDPCIEDLGSLPAPATRSRSGSWTGECASENRAGRYARYYSLTLAGDSIVTIDLTSSDTDTYLYLMRGVGKSGNIIALNDDGGAGRNSRIARTLESGQYTIEATTFSSRATGSFALEIVTEPFNWCVENLGEISGKRKLQVYGQWNSLCQSGNRVGAYAEYRSFTLAESTSVTISMSSSDVSASPYAYLIDGSNWEDQVIGGSTSPRQYYLRPGTYLIEATTLDPGPGSGDRRGVRVEVETSPASILIGEGGSRLGSPAWNEVGVTGRGIKVGLIDGGFSGYDSFGSELPRVDGARCYVFADVRVVSNDPLDCAGSFHGTAVAEALVDIAPDVSLYIANPITFGDLHDAVDWMISEGVEVINQSLSWTFDGPGDGTSPRENSPLRSVDRAVAGGITWVNSAGNARRSTWMGEYSDADGDGFIEFERTDETMGVLANGGQRLFQLRWDDSWTGADTDLDLYVLNSEGRIVARSEDSQTGRAGHIPYESVEISVPSFPLVSQYHVLVKYNSGDAPSWIQLMVLGVGDSLLQYYTNGSITSPGESANPGLLAVGAAPFYDLYTIARYSSRGPTPDGRAKPDIVGPDGALSKVSGRRFFGTSQSSPHVAGMAALVHQQYPSHGPVEVARYLRNQALHRLESDGVTPNNVWGYGFAHLPAPPMLPSGVLLESSNPDPGDQLGVSSSISTDGTTVVVGSLSDGSAGEQSGAAYVLVETMVDYGQFGKLTASDGAAFDYFGSSVAVSGDVSTIAVGAPGDGSGAGSVYVFTKPSGPWTNAAGTVKLTASDGAAGDGFGSSVAMSGDGSMIVVGAPSNDAGETNAGAAYVFTRPATGWATASDGVKLTAMDGAADDEFGSSVSTDSSGSTVAVGARGDSPGSVYVFTMPATGWAAASSDVKLTGPSEIDARAQLGESVSVSGDGSTIVAGSWEAPGAAYVFALPSGGWMETSTSARLTAPDGDARDRFGWSVSTDSDGGTIAVGATAADRVGRVDVGAVYMFERPSDGWVATSMAAGKLQNTLVFSGSDFAHSLSLSGDGGTVVATAPNHLSGGTVNYAKLPAMGGWGDSTVSINNSIHITGLQEHSSFGLAVSTSADEGTVVVGASNDDATASDAGAVYVYTEASGGWESGTAPTRVRLLASDGETGDGFGHSVSVSSDGGVIAVAANGDTSNTGSVYVFTKPATGWASTATSIKLTASDSSTGDQFGSSVAVSGDGNTIVVGANRDQDNGLNSGSAYVFTKPAGGWATSNTAAKLTTSDGAAEDQFGGSVSVSTDGSVIVVGATGRFDVGRSSDAAYVFVRPATGWATTSAPVKLTPSDGGAAAAEFGKSVSVSGDGDTIVVGADVANGNVDDSGAAYVFAKPAAGWAAASSSLKLTASDGALNDDFGGSVSVSSDGSRVAIGAGDNDNDAVESGAVYVFTKPAGGWIATSTASRLPLEHAAAPNRFIGRSVSIGGDVITVGASGASDLDGSAYVYAPLAAPEKVGTIADLTMTEMSTSLLVSVSSNFRDPDGGTLTYAVESSNAAVVTATVTNSGLVTISRVGPGAATISVTATNPYALTATQSFTATVVGTPAVVQDLDAVTYGRTSIELTWSAPQDYGRAIARYELHRKSGGGSYAAVTPAPTLSTGPTITYRDTGLTEGTTYTYRVQAYDSVGGRGWSNEDAATPTGDRDALIAFYDDMNGDDWRNNTNWKTAAQHDDWHGVTTDFDGRVAQLNLSGNGLEGTISTQLENLPTLQWLYLGRNGLTGSIPSELGNLSNLRYLFLYDNSLSGQIPSELGNLSNLQRLYLEGNGLSGSIPSELGNLSNLEWLYLSRNRLSGSIPTELGNLSNLQELLLNGNELSGSIPSELGNLSNLEDIFLHANSLSGQIPPELGNLPSLELLILYGNELTGQIPPELGDLSNLLYLYLDDNELTGQIPPELGDLPNLLRLYLYDNSLSGPIPPELGDLSILRRLLLHGNELTGGIQSDLGDLSRLEWLFLHSNSLSGPIPTQLGNLGRLDDLHLGNNKLTGPIPMQLGRLSNLRHLRLENNELTGSIPSELGELPRLERLHLDGNSLSGTIPSKLGDLSNLGWLYLNNNELSGEIPTELGNLRNLRHLYLGDNELTGSIPSELGNLSSLQRLFLNFNDLSGAVPMELGNLDNLELLFLSGNSLSGAIPSELGGLDNLQGLYLNDNSLSGAIPSELGGLDNLQALYLRDNSLSGPIPTQLGNLDNLEFLRLNGNSLSGVIPSELGNLSNLQTLYLDSNNLSGRIPTELGSLSNLKSMGLSGNSLDGPIPAQLGNLSDLESLDLNNNSLSGRIPTELGSLSSLVSMDLRNNGLWGPIPTQLGGLSNLGWLDISFNSLSGRIPSELGNLSNLQGLLLIDNELTGSIPSELGSLSNLQWLYVNDNRLRGEIPLALTRLTRLTEFYFDGNTGGLCAPRGAAFQAWLMGISIARGPTCEIATPTPTSTPTPVPPSTGGGGFSAPPPPPPPPPQQTLPEIVVSIDTLTFTAVQGGDNPQAQTVAVWNSLRLVDMPFTVSSNTDWLSFSPASASSNSPQARVRVQVSVDASDLKAGTYNGEMVIRATGGASNSPRSITVTLTVTAPLTPVGTTRTTDEATEVVTSDSTVRLEVPAGAAPADVEIRVTKLDMGSVGSPPGAAERVVAAVEVETFVAGSTTPTPMTFPQGVDLRFALPEGDEASCAAGRVRVYWLDGAEWTLLEHRCETDDAGGVDAVSTLTHFSTYVMTIDDTPATPTASPTPTAVPTATPTAVPTATPTPMPPDELPETGGPGVSGALLLMLFLAGGLLIAAGSTILRTRTARETP